MFMLVMLVETGKIKYYVGCLPRSTHTLFTTSNIQQTSIQKRGYLFFRSIIFSIFFVLFRMLPFFYRFPRTLPDTTAQKLTWVVGAGRGLSPELEAGTLLPTQTRTDQLTSSPRVRARISKPTETRGQFSKPTEIFTCSIILVE